jgi:hypothetical protein
VPVLPWKCELWSFENPLVLTVSQICSSSIIRAASNLPTYSSTRCGRHPSMLILNSFLEIRVAASSHGRSAARFANLLSLCLLLEATTSPMVLCKGAAWKPWKSTNDNVANSVAVNLPQHPSLSKECPDAGAGILASRATSPPRSVPSVVVVQFSQRAITPSHFTSFANEGTALYHMLPLLPPVSPFEARHTRYCHH